MTTDIASASAFFASNVETSRASGYDVSPKKLWVSQKAYDNLQNAIVHAEAVAVSKSASKSKVSAAKATLAKAAKAFKPTFGKSNQRVSLKSAKVTNVKSAKYTGKAIKQAPVVKLGGVKLKAGRDYTLSFKNAKGKTVKASKVKAVGKYKLVITGVGKYKGTTAVPFRITAK